MRIGVICNGSVENYQWFATKVGTCDKIICADGGANHAFQVKIKPDLIIGDLDSVKSEVLEYYSQRQVEILRYPQEKDDTDQRLALQAAVNMGAKEVLLLAAIGNRLDHTLGSLSVLAFLHAKGIKGEVSNEYNEVTLCQKEAVIHGEQGQEVSLLPLSTQVTGITTENLQYALKDAIFELGNPYGISNVLTAPVAKVTFNEGLLLVLKSRDRGAAS